MSKEMDKDPQGAVFGRLLKFWRGVHGLSQEALALSLDASTRHISFLENGRASPSKAMVEAIADVMKLGVRDSGHLLVAAGYTPDFESLGVDAPELKWFRKAITLSLKALDPYPSMVVNTYGKVVMVNRGWVSFFKALMSAEELAAVEDHYDFVFKRLNDYAHIPDWKNASALILMGLQQQAIFSGDEKTQQLVDRLATYPSVPKNWQQVAAKIEPMASFRVPIEIDGQVQPFFNVVQHVDPMAPAAFLSEPRLSMITFYPENPDFKFESVEGKELSHPLLAY
jgi:transcriptional regulator with XRE-family HTH domain